ncbi:4-amino-4-deoxy-L-arabinose transferase [Pricia antarctica]|uniref:4-amino-4-deoxy-L-arabinose transferase n=1 Tax=Pricia antarctica TaxID=641691 RepID=A0A1G7J6P2_9FLAO|nr:glycosyltransferase family 39 protein [Pricia antarctica]SDF20563.1 4-amino-4-deoxy-L-arabinose transferase [Pricia antarctica]
MIPNLRYWFLLVLIVLVYVAGSFVTLMENDSAQFAVMAMRMYQENDFINLFKGSEEYLDKPHMHYWLAALSYTIFGLHDWAYRIPGILVTLLGAYSCFGLGRLLYTIDTGKVAALVFMTAQTIMLSAIDVRTDAVLTGFTIFAIWQLTVYIEKRSLLALILGALGAGLAFSTKGQIALLVIGIAVLCHLAYTRKWRALVNWKVLVALFVFALAITPMLYAYYLQFDMHPEKIIRGRGDRSGLFFIFWEQSFERLSGEGMGANSSDYFFFFHTFLWVFVPWTILGIVAYATRIKALFKVKFAYKPKYEFLTLGTITLFFLIASFSQFKLPHYLNIIIPLFSVLTASYIHDLYRTTRTKPVQILLGVQYFILSIVFVATLLICFFVFPFKHIYASILLIILLLVITYFCLKREAYYLRILTLSVYSSLLLNAVLNLHFYPNLLMYQAGSRMAEVVAEEQIPVDTIYKLGDFHTWSLDFYNQRPVGILSLQNLRKKHNLWLYVNDTELQKLHDQGFDWDRQYTKPHFRITRLSKKFLDPSTRKRTLDTMHLIHMY